MGWVGWRYNEAAMCVCARRREGVACARPVSPRPPRCLSARSHPTSRGDVERKVTPLSESDQRTAGSMAGKGQRTVEGMATRDGDGAADGHVRRDIRRIHAILTCTTIHVNMSKHEIFSC